MVLICKLTIGSRKTSDYRPIGLLSEVGKIYERVVEFGFRSSVDKKNIISAVNHGLSYFKSSRKNNQGFSLNFFTQGIFMDVAKAFDKVSRMSVDHSLRNAN